MKRCLLALAIALCATSFGWEEVWQSDEVGRPSSVHVIGVVSGGPYGPELIFVSSENWDARGYVFVYSLSLNDGYVEPVSDDFYEIYTDDGNAPRLIDVNGDGLEEVLFLGNESANSPPAWYLYGYETSGATREGRFRRISGPSLGRNTQNPFKRETRIDYEVTAPGPVKLRVYDSSGRMVKELEGVTDSSGRSSAVWQRDDSEGRPVPAGVYFYALESDGVEQTRKALVVD